MTNLPFRLLGPLLLLTLASSALAGDEPFRAIDYEAARSAAKSEEKLLLIAFVDKQPESRALDATWRDAKVKEWIATKAVAITVDVETSRALAESMRVDRVPTIVFVGADGLELDRIRGPRDAKGFLADAASAESGKGAVARTKEKLAGHERDPWLRLDHASALHDQGLLREALEHYLYCWDTGATTDPSFASARKGAVLAGLGRLGEVYPPAIDAVIERVQSLGQKMASNVATEAEVGEFVELTTRFQRRDLLLQIHDLLREKGESTATVRKQLAPSLIERLMEERRFDEALVSLGDPEKELEKRIGELAAQGRSGDESIAARERVTRFAVDCFEAALATGKPDLARKLAERSLAFDGSVETYANLIRRARRAGETSIAIALMRRGLDGSLTPEDKVKLRNSTVAFPRLK